jgi:hypothetical protein
MILVKTASGLFNDVMLLMKVMTIYKGTRSPDAYSSPEWACQTKKSIILAPALEHFLDTVIICASRASAAVGVTTPVTSCICEKLYMSHS